MPPRKTASSKSSASKPATKKTSTASRRRPARKQAAAKPASSSKAEKPKKSVAKKSSRPAEPVKPPKPQAPKKSSAKKTSATKQKPQQAKHRSPQPKAKPKRLDFGAQKLAGSNVFPAPLLIGCLKTEAGLDQLQAANVPADLIEVRVDELLQANVKLSAIEQALRKRRHPVLLTARAANEGGAYNWQKGERTKVLFQLMDHADALDLELEHLPQLKRVHEAAITEELSLILSVHSIQHPASNEQLRTWMHEFQQHEAFVYKIAMRLNQQSDLHQLVDALLRNPHRRWALMGLGPDAPKSRLVLTGLGSVLVYGYLDKPTAPGQPSTRQLIKALG